MSSQHDDLDAVKKVVDALEPFQSEERERIIRWACEKLGVSGQRSVGTHPDRQREEKDGERRDAPAGGSAARGTDIRTFVNEKKPDSDIQFATTVAYFYAFESPEAERKLSISSDDLQNACRYIGRERLNV
ncbi:hypothetical protein LL252_04770 [Alcanivorax marinus]|uniref:Uncharacterized protein n=1 Tax=Alloalcanivorax marinus TaxID=1177169 RepID=A0A9Q3YQS9_9GAMM|nr:hypothetical protein [Alloalcanivorax marinus]MCC4307878.1 hypothetical protein [Alloalcanivorax marinus]